MGDAPAEQKKKSNQKKAQKPLPEYNDYLIFFHKKPVEVHVAYGNTILKLKGILRSKARYDIQVILDEEKKDIVVINKAHIVMIKPL